MPLVKAVPWSSKRTWLKVYNSLLSEDAADKKLALDFIDAWRSRMRLPVALECTSMLLSVLLETPSSQVALGNSLVRSLNFLVDQLQTGATAQSVESLASRLGIPKWVVDLRHDIVHGIHFPQISVLTIACELLFQRLLDSYWHPQAALFSEDRKIPEIPDLDTFFKMHNSAPTSKTAVHELKQLAQQISDFHAALWLLKLASDGNFQVAADLSSLFMKIFSPEFPIHLINAVAEDPHCNCAVDLLLHVIGNFPRIKDFARHRIFAETRRRAQHFDYAEKVLPLLTLEISPRPSFLFVGLGKTLDWDSGEIHSFLSA